MSGNCTNGRAGAFSGAALASQAIGDLAGSSTGLETSAAEQAIEEREKAEAACPPDQVLVDGICKARPPVSAPAVIAAPPPTVPAPPPVSVAAPATAAPPASAAPAPAAQKHPAKAKVAGRPPSGALPTKKPVYEGPPVYDQSFRIGSWAQGFGDYDHRSGSQTISFSCCLALRNSPPTTPVTLEANSTTSSGGFIGGIDFTKRGLTGPQDGLIAGVLGGYIWNNITINNSILPLFPSSVGNGSSRTTATINGPSVGLYATYFNGPFSNEFLIKNDFLSLNQNQSGVLGFGACSCLNLGAATAFQLASAGSGSTTLNQLTISDNADYKFPIYNQMWIGPTAGIRYLDSNYGSGAAALGLSDGYIFRIQGGAKLGMDWFAGDTHLTTTLTGLIFDDVAVQGNNIQGGSFGPAGNILSDQGKAQGEAIASLNFDFGHGLSASILGDVYGGQNIFGAGGKATIRMQW